MHHYEIKYQDLHNANFELSHFLIINQYKRDVTGCKGDHTKYLLL